MFDEVAKIVKPHKRPVFSEEQRTRMVERLKDYQFRPQENAVKPS
jgi:hypothetical protein